MAAGGMTEAFLADIIGQPGDDFPRLAYADWLEENGDTARADFIRIQCELARVNPGPDAHARAANILKRCRRGAPVRLSVRTPATLLAREAILLGGLDPFASPSETNCYKWAGPAVGLISMLRPVSDYLAFTRGFISEVRCSAADWLRHGAAVLAAHPVVRVEFVGGLALSRQGEVVGLFAARVADFARLVVLHGGVVPT